MNRASSIPIAAAGTLAAASTWLLEVKTIFFLVYGLLKIILVKE